MIETTKACTVAFMKPINWKTKQEMVKIHFFKVLANRFWLTSKVVLVSTKLFMADLLSIRIHEKVMIFY